VSVRCRSEFPTTGHGELLDDEIVGALDQSVIGCMRSTLAGGTAGLSFEALSKFTPDCDPSHKCSTSAPSIFSQVPSWKAYEESMPTNCDRKNKGEYAVRHNPPPYYTTLSECATKDVPYTQLAGDLAGGTLPAFSFVTPNLIGEALTANSMLTAFNL
jgi:hypothetical protein